MDVTYFRPRRAGPELALEDVVAEQGPSLLLNNEQDQTWTAGSLPLGAGMPDLTFVSFDPDVVVALCGRCSPTVGILAYLRAVREAKLETIAQRTNHPVRIVERILDELSFASLIECEGKSFGLSTSIRNVLPEVVTVEAKVSNWKSALSQAARNTIFAHHSYVALPMQTARRVRAEPRFLRFGVGILGIEDDEVFLVRRSRRQQPRVWSYYYKLAVTIANHALGDQVAIHRSN